MRFKIQYLQWTSAVATAIACLVIGGTSIITNYAEYQRYKDGGEQFTRYASALSAAIAISAERGPSNSLMGAADERRLEFLAALRAKRAESDRALNFLEAHFAGEMNEASLRGEMAFLRVQLALARAVVDGVAATPKTERTGRQVAHAIETMFAVADRAMGLRDRLGQVVIEIAPQAATEVLLSSMAGTMREHAGRLGSYVVMMLVSNSRDDATYGEEIHHTDAHLQELRRLLNGYAGAFFTTPEIGDKIKEVETAFFGGAMLYATTVARINGPLNDMTAAQFTRDYVPGMRPTEELWRLIAKTSADAMSHRREAAFELVLLSAATVGLVIIVLAAMATIYKNFLFRPLLAAREQIIAIAQGDLTQPEQTKHVSREIRDMFEGLHVLRNGQLIRRELEQDRLRMAEQLKRLSETDPLTGIANRRVLDSVAASYFEESELRLQPVGLVLFDIDHFKLINDTYGHAVGDQVLQAVTRQLASIIRRQDLFARYGGEEFAVLVPRCTLGDLALLAERLRQKMENVTVSDKLQLDVSASFGVALRQPGMDLSWDKLVSIADRRMYLAKRAGRNLVCAGDDLPKAIKRGQSAA